MKRLYRSRKHKVLGGVLGGLAEYFEIDPVLPRIIFLALFILVKQVSWFMVIAYIVSCIILPKKSEYLTENTEGSAREITESTFPKDSQKILAWSFIIIGGVALLSFLMPTKYISSLNHFTWPILLVLAGVVVLIASIPKSK